MISDLLNIVQEYLMVSERQVKRNYFFVVSNLELLFTKYDFENCICPNMCLSCIEYTFLNIN